ncbi:MAG: FeoA family protein [Bacteroidota bacterium]
MDKTKSAIDLAINEIAQIASFSNEQLAGKFMAMGVLPGSKVCMVRKAPFGGAYYLKVDRHSIAVRKEEAECIILK